MIDLAKYNHGEKRKERKKIKSSEANLRQMIIQAPVNRYFGGIVVEIANQKALDYGDTAKKRF
jgi:hypothetical protein